MSELSSQLEGAATSGPDPVALTENYSIVLGPVDVQLYDRWTIYIQNVGGGGGNDITSVHFQGAPTEDGPWMDIDEALAADLVSGASDYAPYADSSQKYIQVRSKCGAGNTTTAKFWLCMGGLE